MSYIKLWIKLEIAAKSVQYHFNQHITDYIITEAWKKGPKRERFTDHYYRELILRNHGAPERERVYTKTTPLQRLRHKDHALEQATTAHSASLPCPLCCRIARSVLCRNVIWKPITITQGVRLCNYYGAVLTCSDLFTGNSSCTSQYVRGNRTAGSLKTGNKFTTTTRVTHRICNL